MKQRAGILRITAFLLLLIFTQKIGIGLALHNFFHQPFAVDSSAKQDAQGKDFSYACTCADDFLAPFTVADEMEIPAPVVKFVVTGSTGLFAILPQNSIHSSLRGPPVTI